MTQHSIERTIERAGLPLKASVRLIESAYIKGKKSNCFPADERRYMQAKEKQGAEALYYSGFCFLFSKEGQCITMYPTPEWFGKAGRYYGKIRIRNPKKFYKLNSDYVALEG